MTNIKRVTPVVVLTRVEEGDSVSYKVEQKFSVDNIEVSIQHSCFAYNDNPVAVTDFDRDSFQPLNTELERKLIDHYGDTSKAFEIYELISIEASKEVRSVL
jgi:hypothetical protein